MKYGNQRTWSELCQRMFDSKLEARRGEELALLERAGEIHGLQYQVGYTLTDLGVKPKVRVTVDFFYYDGLMPVHEDAKGVLTRDSRTRYAWLKQQQEIEVVLWRG